MPNSAELITNLVSIFEDPVGTARPLWRDTARYQMYWNHDVAAANGVTGVACRAGISYGYIDPFFNYQYGGAKDKMYRTSYHVLYPDQPIVRQADEVWYKAQPEIEIIPRVIDLEVSRGMAWDAIGEVVWNMSNLVLRRDGVRPLIYTRYRIVQEWLRKWTPEMLNSHYWWFAQYRYLRYLEHKGPPTLPVYQIGSHGPVGSQMINRSRVVLHQTADKKAPFPGEVPTTGAGKSIDWDRWEIGDEAGMHRWIKQTWGEGTAPPPPLPPAEKHVKTTTNLNVREQPDASSKDIGTLKQGTDVTVVEQQGDWYKLKEGWIHRNYTAPV